MNVFLTGFMGTGKTVVGRALARQMGRPFVDVDEEIERTAGRSVSEIFSEEGESAFRALERRALEAVCARDGLVVATGGGAVVDPENRRRMRASGRLVGLEAPPATVLERVGIDASRPLLAGADEPLARIHELLSARQAAYADVDRAFDTSGREPEEIARRIAEWLAAEGET